MAQTIGITTTHFVLDVAGGLPEVIYTSDGDAYLHLPGVIVAESASGGKRYLLGDGLGSIRQEVDEGGAVVVYHEFDPYGVPLRDGGEPYGYTGEWWQAEVGLLHLRARWYAPEVGRFISADTAAPEPPISQTLNRYAYVYNNPLRYTDSSGHQGCEGQDCALDPYIEGYVKEYAPTYGVPWQIVAGVLKSEIELDTQPRDILENAFWTLNPWPLNELYLALRDPGPGIGNVHVTTARIVAAYVTECHIDSFTMQWIGRQKVTDIAQVLTLHYANVEVVAAYVGMLADFRFGTNGQPDLGDHINLSDWTIVDSTAVWHGYRYGVPGVSPSAKGFSSLDAFQDRSYDLYGLLWIARGEDAERSIFGSIPYFRYYFNRQD